jgi:hypothetical protein
MAEQRASTEGLWQSLPRTRLAIRALLESRDYKINWSGLASSATLPTSIVTQLEPARDDPTIVGGINTEFIGAGGSPAEYRAPVSAAIAHGRLTLHPIVGIIRHRADDLDDRFRISCVDMLLAIHRAVAVSSSSAIGIA